MHMHDLGKQEVNLLQHLQVGVSEERLRQAVSHIPDGRKVDII